MLEIYLDNAATTKPLASLSGVLEEYLRDGWHNPSALYAPAVRDMGRLEEARDVVRQGFGQMEAVFTGSGTEADSAVILAGAKKRKNMHYVTTAAEHEAVYQAMKRLAEEGRQVTFVRPDRQGVVYPEDVAQEVREDTALVSVMHVSNQTGAVSDIAAIARAVKAKNAGALFHSDGVQAYMRVPAPAAEYIDYYTVSAHKIHGMKGAGAVLYKKSSPMQPLIPGGGQERGLRSGTENTFGIAAFAHAAAFFSQHREEFVRTLNALKEAFLEGIAPITDKEILSPPDGAPHIVCFTVAGVRGEVLLHALEAKGIYISTGSACTSKKGVGRVAKGLGLSKSEAEGVVRVSFSPFNTKEEIRIAAGELAAAVKQQRMYTRK